MKATNALQAFGFFENLKVSSGKVSCSSCGLPTGPTGNSAWFMSSTIAVMFCALAAA
jgi:hypothetical protein